MYRYFFPALCRRSDADDFLLEICNDLANKLEETNLALVKAQQEIARLSPSAPLVELTRSDDSANMNGT